MRHPFWIVNSALLFLLLFIIGFAYFFRYPLPEREFIKLGRAIKPITKEKLQINIIKIYENDLFDTYKKEPPVEEKPNFIEPLPEPPQPQTVSVPEPPEPQFLEPTNITLKGIITSNIDNNKNRAIIEDNKTKQEAIHLVGDTIEDARLIRILNNKIILLRTNGQQEVLYLSAIDAKNDPAYAVIDSWDVVVKKITDTEYTVNTKEFISRITNLGQMVDLLGLTTAYEKGISIGCRIGLLDEKSIGPQLGLQAGDIILSINNIPADNTENRFIIYQQILELPNNARIELHMRRDATEQTIHYTLESDTEAVKTAEKEQDQAIKETNFSVLKERYSLAPTMKEIRMHEKQNMLKKGKQIESLSTSVSE